MLERWFRLTESGVTARGEIAAGATTFLAMSYIVLVQPALLADAGMDVGAVTAATCLTAAVASIAMGLWARYPVALAPGMGINAFFVFQLVPAADAAGHAEPWRAALGVVFVSGVLFVALSATGVRERLLAALSPSLRHAIAAGIGLFITFLGLRSAGLVEANPATLVALTRELARADVAIAALGTIVAAAAAARGVRGGILLGIGTAAAVAIGLRVLLPLESLPPSLARLALPTGLLAAPPSLAPTFFAMDVGAALTGALVPFVLVFLFVDVFDTLGTLVAVSEQGGLVRDGKLPRAGRAFATDAMATVAGACLGTSTVTSYIESAAGIAAGGRTGLVAVVVGIGFPLAMLVSPVIASLGSYPPITAPALLMVGAAMLRSVEHVAWGDTTEGLPALLVVVGIPLTFSIGDGIALGLVAYPLVKTLAGRHRDVRPTLWVVAAALLAYLTVLRG